MHATNPALPPYLLDMRWWPQPSITLGSHRSTADPCVTSRSSPGMRMYSRLLGDPPRQHLKFGDSPPPATREHLPEGDVAVTTTTQTSSGMTVAGVTAKPSGRMEAVRQPQLANLNKSQRDAVLEFVQGDNELCLLQGPPGTGKTTTLVALLSLLEDDAKQPRTMVCAPSNRAVHEVLTRFLQSRNWASVVLVGDTGKLPGGEGSGADAMSVYTPTTGDHAQAQERLQSWSLHDVFVL